MFVISAMDLIFIVPLVLLVLGSIAFLVINSSDGTATRPAKPRTAVKRVVEQQSDDESSAS